MASRYSAYVRLDDIVPAVRNPKIHDLPGIKRALREFGVVGPIALWDERTGRIVAGHGRREGLTELHTDGAPPPDGVEANEAGEWLVPVWRGWSSRDDAHAEAYIIADNHLNEKGGNDERALAQMMVDIDDPALALATGYDADEYDDFKALLEEAPPPPFREPAGSGGWDDEAEGEGDDVTGQTRRTRGLDDLKDDYEASNVRVLVLSYPGPRYVWAVQQLAALSQKYGVENNSDAVLRVLSDVTGETPPNAT